VNRDFATLQKTLKSTVYAQLDFNLRLQEPLEIPAFGLLRLRRGFNRIAQNEAGTIRGRGFRELLKPPLSADPGILRRVQQPAPGFVLRPVERGKHRLDRDDRLVLQVGFIGEAVKSIVLFSELVESLGLVGLLANHGRFTLETIENSLPGAAERVIWQDGVADIAPHLADLALFLENYPPQSTRFELLTPARVLSDGRPVFAPAFEDIFPFILRRVTAMLAVWCGCEELFDSAELLACARQLEVSQNELKWLDWRPLKSRNEAGGVCGSVVLEGPRLASLWPILKLGELFGVGKGAAFGAGQFRLV